MRLLEMVAGDKTPQGRLRGYSSKFADIKLGKGIVDCKDTPGFIANRIGVFWMMVGLLEAHAFRAFRWKRRMPLWAGRSASPKPVLFGLFDLIGIDLMPHIAKAMLDTLPPQDRVPHDLQRAGSGEKNDRRRLYGP